MLRKCKISRCRLLVSQFESLRAMLHASPKSLTQSHQVFDIPLPFLIQHLIMLTTYALPVRLQVRHCILNTRLTLAPEQLTNLNEQLAQVEHNVSVYMDNASAS